VSVVVA